MKSLIGLLSIVVALAALLGGLGVWTGIQHQRAVALEARLQAEEARSEAVAEFLAASLASDASPQAAITVTDVLDEAERKIEEIEDERPEIAARLRETIAMARAAQSDERRDWAKLSPYPALRWEGPTPVVLVDDRWYELRSIDGIDVARITAFCETTYGSRARKRFGEDLVQVLGEMGHPVDTSVTLELHDRAAGKTIVRDNVPMTAANRQAVWKGELPEPAARIVRGHAAVTPERYAFLAERMSPTTPGRRNAAMLAAEPARQDLDELEWQLVNRFSYLTLRDVEYEAALDAIRTGLGDGIAVDDFAIQIQKLLCLFGDGHAGVGGFDGMLPGGRNPFLLADDEHGVVAFRADRSGLVDPRHPYVSSIDDVPIDAWIEAAGSVVPAGSAQAVRARSLRMLRQIAWAAGELGRPGDDAPGMRHTWVLRSPDGTSSISVPVDTVEDKPVYGEWPRTSSTLRADGIGYLRIARMSDEAARHVDQMMPEFAGAKGLIIDVRGNSGGSRMALLRLAPWLMPPDAGPIVANVAAYREHASFPDDHLAARFMYTADHRSWKPRQREAVERFAAGFRPEWSPPPGDFSPRHFFVLDRSLNPDAVFFEGPVVVLMDGGCFSATDIFLGAMDLLPRVTLLGTPSHGGSGRSQRFTLSNSGLQVRLSSMASFRPDGRLYDGRGIEPDVLVEPAERDFIQGGADRQLEAAIELIAASQ